MSTKYRILDLRDGEYLNDWSEDYVTPVVNEFYTLESAEKYINSILGYSSATRLNIREHFEIEEIP